MKQAYKQFYDDRFKEIELNPFAEKYANWDKKTLKSTRLFIDLAF